MRSFHPGLWLPCPCPSQCITSSLLAGRTSGGSNPLQPETWKRQPFAGLFLVFVQPLHSRCSLVGSTPPHTALFTAAVAGAARRAGQPSFCGSQKPLWPGNSGLMLGAGTVPSLADPSGPGHHDRCWEHMPGINSLRLGHKRGSLFLSLLPTPLLSDFYFTKGKIGLFSLPCS